MKVKFYNETNTLGLKKSETLEDGYSQAIEDR